MPTKEYVDTEPAEWIGYAQRVVRELNQYTGAVIVKEVHPLWLAVVELEKASVKTLPAAANRQPANGGRKLHYPAGPWYRTIWASRKNEIGAAAAWGEVFYQVLLKQIKYVQAGVRPKDLSTNAEYREEVRHIWDPRSRLD